MLKRELKLAQWAGGTGKESLQMLGRLQQRIRLRTIGWLQSLAQARAQPIKSLRPAGQQVIAALQHQGQAQLFDRCLNRAAAQKLL